MRLTHLVAVGLAVFIGAAVTANQARADAIDGDWCKSGAQLTIEGRQITTPGGTVMQGNYDRHSFTYVVPDGESGAGDEIFMQQLNEENMRLMVGSWTADAEHWLRCDFVS